MLFSKEKFLGFLALILSKIFDVTYKYVYLNPQEKINAIKISPTNNFIWAHWHQTFHPIMMLCQYQNFSSLVSPSKDGDIVTVVANGFTIKICRGSSSRGGAFALKQILSLIKNGSNALVTIDGPRGPIYRAKRGIFDMSKRTGVPILPITNYPTSFWEFKSWDKFRIAKPFSTIYVKYGSPFIVPKNYSSRDLIEYSQTIEQNLLKLEQDIIEYIATT